MSTDKAKYYTTTHASIPYLCHASSIPLADLPTLAHKIPQLFAFLAATTPPTTPAGPPFFRYVAIPIGMGHNQLVDMEVGVPVPKGFSLAGINSSSYADTSMFEVKSLPSGTYLETIHIGAPITLIDATRRYLQYSEEEGVEFDVQKSSSGILSKRDEGGDGEVRTQMKDRWVARIEYYESDPAVVDEREWRTRLSFKLR